MQPSITSPERFAFEFNQTVPGAYRKITAEDTRLMTECGLIGRYRYYADHDLQTVINILRYEQLREKRIEKEEKIVTGVRLCKICGTPLPSQEAIRKGRNKEFCSKCEPLRLKLRYQKWRKKKLELAFSAN